MGKSCVEVCLISARGLRRSTLWKLQWFAVGWVDPKTKYCTRIDAPGSSNPVWNTKFKAFVDDKSNDVAPTLTVQVYSREPIFLRETLHGTATILLGDSLSDPQSRSDGPPTPGSYQLRKSSSDKPRGFVDVSIRVLEHNNNNNNDDHHDDDHYSFVGNEGGDTNEGNSITLANGDGPTKAIPIATGPSYYVPPRLPQPDRFVSDTYINMTSSSSSSSSVRPGFAMGLGAGALAAGAVIFGDDFISGFDVPSSSSNPNVVVSIDPPFLK